MTSPALEIYLLSEFMYVGQNVIFHGSLTTEPNFSNFPPSMD